ncbi:putative arabinogalactan peptide, AGP [Lupinus albus]|uniref:Putative arabinogalactan peptide, AGP n=1 Tax=Lupinus albus TaxID=3870 RepID=A0A6A4Q217_LUPAL|nr:putative arabinogalactan peptide, AGP [Lupinus albus]
MVSPQISFGFEVLFILATFIFAAHGQSPAPAPAPTSDGSIIDQGIAYLLMLLAMLLTYLIH